MIITVNFPIKAIGKKIEAWKKFNGIRTRDLRDTVTRDLRDTGAMLYQLSYEAIH